LKVTARRGLRRESLNNPASLQIRRVPAGHAENRSGGEEPCHRIPFTTQIQIFFLNCAMKEKQPLKKEKKEKREQL